MRIFQHKRGGELIAFDNGDTLYVYGFNGAPANKLNVFTVEEVVASGWIEVYNDGPKRTPKVGDVLDPFATDYDDTAVLVLADNGEFYWFNNANDKWYNRYEIVAVADKKPAYDYRRDADTVINYLRNKKED